MRKDGGYLVIRLYIELDLFACEGSDSVIFMAVSGLALEAWGGWGDRLDVHGSRGREERRC